VGSKQTKRAHDRECRTQYALGMMCDCGAEPGLLRACAEWLVVFVTVAFVVWFFSR
jgi:hypothetical protein